MKVVKKISSQNWNILNNTLELDWRTQERKKENNIILNHLLNIQFLMWIVVTLCKHCQSQDLPLKIHKFFHILRSDETKKKNKAIVLN